MAGSLLIFDAQRALYGQISFFALYIPLLVRGNNGKIAADLEMLDIVHFTLFLVRVGPYEAFPAECKFFYPVAFSTGC